MPAGAGAGAGAGRGRGQTTRGGGRGARARARERGQTKRGGRGVNNRVSGETKRLPLAAVRQPRRLERRQRARAERRLAKASRGEHERGSIRSRRDPAVSAPARPSVRRLLL